MALRRRAADARHAGRAVPPPGTCRKRSETSTLNVGASRGRRYNDLCPKRSMLPAPLARRTFLAHSGVSLGAMALSSLLARSLPAATDIRSRGVIKTLHHPPRIKRVIWLY